MRAALLVVLIAVAPRAADAGDYPAELTDRPILMPAGMWALDLGLGFSENRITTTDMGRTTTTQRSLGESGSPSLELGRSFGAFTVSAGLVGDLETTVEVQLGDRPAYAYVTFGYAPPVGNIRHSYRGRAGIAYKDRLAPGRFALFAIASAGADDVALDATTDQPAISGLVSDASAGVTAEVQLFRRLALSAGPGLDVTITNSTNVETPVVASAAGSLLLALGRVDLRASFGAHWIRGHRLLDLGFGGELRW